MLVLVRMPDGIAAVAAARESFQRGRVKHVRLQDLPPIRRTK